MNSPKETFQNILSVIACILCIYGVVLGFKASFYMGVLYFFLIITPVVTAALHLVTGFDYNLAVTLTNFVDANPGVMGFAALMGIAVISWTVLGFFAKLMTMGPK